MIWPTLLIQLAINVEYYEIMNTYLCSSLSYPNLAIPAKYCKHRSSIPFHDKSMATETMLLPTHLFKNTHRRRESTLCKPSIVSVAMLLSWKGNRAPVLAVFGRNCKVRIRQRRTQVSIHYLIIFNINCKLN